MLHGFHQVSDEDAQAAKEEKEASRTRSFMPLSLPGRKKAKAGKDEPEAADEATNTTVVVSCSQVRVGSGWSVWSYLVAALGTIVTCGRTRNGGHGC